LSEDESKKPKKQLKLHSHGDHGNEASFLFSEDEAYP